jgi:hypothetical protein
MVIVFLLLRLLYIYIDEADFASRVVISSR